MCKINILHSHQRSESIMITYAKTFAKFGVPKSIPLEDQFFFRNNFAIVADGITRDSYGCLDLKKVSSETILKNYPNPSPATKAAMTVCETFKKSQNANDLKKLMCLANSMLTNLNKNVKCNYLENDYAACVAAVAYINKNRLFYSYICDCGVIVWDKNGNIRFQTTDDKSVYSDPYIAKALVSNPWHTPMGRVVTRSLYRNNPNHIINGKCVSYGALTGEKEAEYFIKEGSILLNPGDTVAVYSDGFTPYFKLPDFFENLDNLDNFVKLIESQPNFGSEKTIVVMHFEGK